MLLSLHFKTGFYQIHWVCYKKHPSGLSDKTADYWVNVHAINQSTPPHFFSASVQYA